MCNKTMMVSVARCDAVPQLLHIGVKALAMASRKPNYGSEVSARGQAGISFSRGHGHFE